MKIKAKTTRKATTLALSIDQLDQHIVMYVLILLLHHVGVFVF